MAERNARKGFGCKVQPASRLAERLSAGLEQDPLRARLEYRRCRVALELESNRETSPGGCGVSEGASTGQMSELYRDL
jgi:hypothetical protein